MQDLSSATTSINQVNPGIKAILPQLVGLTVLDIGGGRFDANKIYAEYNDKYIYGKTLIPFKPDVISTDFIPKDYYFEADVNCKDYEVYAALWIVAGTPPDKADDLKQYLEFE